MFEATSPPTSLTISGNPSVLPISPISDCLSPKRDLLVPEIPCLNPSSKFPTASFIGTLFLTNSVKKQAIEDAREAAKNITGGLYGQIQRNLLGKFKPNDKQLGEWQKIKMVLTDAQLLNTAKTKGAISDKEMELFAKAAANDDIGSISAMSPVFDRLMSFMEADEKAKINAYKKSYGEDPTQWEEIQPFMSNNGIKNNQKSDDYNVTKSGNKWKIVG